MVNLPHCSVMMQNETKKRLGDLYEDEGLERRLLRAGRVMARTMARTLSV
jgi:hypothetical protein